MAARRPSILAIWALPLAQVSHNAEPALIGLPHPSQRGTRRRRAPGS
jgi:hypothetical protein